MLLGVAGAVLLAAAAQQLAGFGFALMAMPLLSVLLGPRDAVVVASLASLAGGTVMTYRLRALVDRPVLGRLALGAVVGLPLGVVVLGSVSEDPLKVAVALAVLAMVVILAAGFRFREERPRTEVGAGFVSGVMGTSLGIGGPPVVLALQASDMAQHTFRATTVAFFVLCNLGTLPLVLGSGVVGLDAWPAAVVAVPTALAGNWVFGGVAQRVSAERFRPLVLALLVLSALAALASALA